MSESVILWIFGGILALLGTVLKLLHSEHNKTSDRVNTISDRLIKLETLFDIVGANMLKALHCPTDKYGLDFLSDEYHRRGYELTLEQWQALRDRTAEMILDPKENPDVKAMASFLNGLAQHKLSPLIKPL